MTVATITSKGQVTIPAIVRNDLHVGPGDRLDFVKISDNTYEIVAATQDVSLMKGMIKAKDVVSIDDMDRGIRLKATK